MTHTQSQEGRPSLDVCPRVADGDPSGLSYMEHLSREYFAIKTAYHTATDEEWEKLPDKQTATCKAIIATTPSTPADALAFLDVALADFREFAMDSGNKSAADLPDDGDRLVYLSMVHARNVLADVIGRAG